MKLWIGKHCASLRGRRCACLGFGSRSELTLLLLEQVWSIRVDVHFLDDEGNMLDCASMAAITALRHFRRPDVTVVGEDVTIVSSMALFPNLHRWSDLSTSTQWPSTSPSH